MDTINIVHTITFGQYFLLYSTLGTIFYSKISFPFLKPAITNIVHPLF